MSIKSVITYLSSDNNKPHFDWWNCTLTVFRGGCSHLPLSNIQQRFWANNPTFLWTQCSSGFLQMYHYNCLKMNSVISYLLVYWKQYGNHIQLRNDVKLTKIVTRDVTFWLLVFSQVFSNNKITWYIHCANKENHPKVSTCAIGML